LFHHGSGQRFSHAGGLSLTSDQADAFSEWPGPGQFTSPQPLGIGPFYQMNHESAWQPISGREHGLLHPTGHYGTAPVQTQRENDPAIESLKLSDVARKAAYELKRNHPSVIFTSGLRSRADQARAMGANVVRERGWIKGAYTDSAARDACQKWVNDHPQVNTKTEIADGLKSVLDGFSDARVGELSRHLSGNAFDVKPIEAGGEAIKKTMRSLAHEARKHGNKHAKFLDKEGSLIRWHIQF
jgi:hypothetical protein